MIRKLFVVMTVTSALAASPAFAGEGNQARHSGNAGNAGQNQQMDQAGTQSGQGRSFDQLDQDNDGQLSESELNAYGATAAGQQTSAKNRGEQAMQRLDEDRNGSVSREELQQAQESQTGESNW
ncbi:hypothetical protein RE428_45960 [Marinobacter nanhaiticus D15-8W]|uniref:EF-hand domain-containing protein n=1 Tax=Marinobacter nanhaiticus D15-8W TaxID=626887 RepID=N6WWX1_9GAMM|nr:EF-hand domain-containing protein [Marinobacter nanhaiticus]ENO15572.1 EF-hand domain-containing protein [Marinobacter nanhaiticus D15-8W]BES73578.1 hypothetical protein RE428_45960 [Marinobacter nanhaiticus D15-8W]